MKFHNPLHAICRYLLKNALIVESFIKIPYLELLVIHTISGTFLENGLFRIEIDVKNDKQKLLLKQENPFLKDLA